MGMIATLSQLLLSIYFYCGMEVEKNRPQWNVTLTVKLQL